MKNLVICALCALFFSSCAAYKSKEYQMYKENLKIYEYYCDIGLSYGCQNAANLIAETKPSKRAFDYLIKACDLGNYEVCEKIAKIYKGKKDEAIEKIANVEYNSEKIMYYARKAHDAGYFGPLYHIHSGREAANIGKDGFGEYLKKEDAIKFIDIDESVELYRKHCANFIKIYGNYKSHTMRCVVDAARHYFLGAFESGKSKIGKGRDIQKAKEYILNAEVNKDTYDEFLGIIYYAEYLEDTMQALESIIKEKCQDRQIHACRLYEQYFGKK